MQFLTILSLVLSAQVSVAKPGVSCNDQDFKYFLSVVAIDDLYAEEYGKTCPWFINRRDGSDLDMTPLMHSVYTHGKPGEPGGYRVIQYLLAHGAYINATDKNGYTALHDAVWYGNVHVVRLLLKHGADPNIRNSDGQRPLDIALSVIGNDEKPRVNQAIVALLREHGARRGNRQH